MTFNGAEWSGHIILPDHGSLGGPGLAVLDDKLYCVHRGHAGDTQLWYATCDGTSWTKDTKLPAHKSGNTPGLISYRDKNADRSQLLCVHQGFDDRAAWQAAEEAERAQAPDGRPA
ncbi:hypothetical protein SHKM778_46350 [Streptomyces sp. KM77-8]|uniref:Uncharacterized protein n=1 Tax=Streptomyces haneummycinicus TaxID=3074435 RepID=A0AAT9HL32_9ACTN